MLIRPLFESFNRMVTGGTLEELSRSVIRWLDQHCTLITLRPGEFNTISLIEYRPQGWGMHTAFLTEHMGFSIDKT